MTSRAGPHSPIDFYFDFSSSYTYIGLHRIEALAQRHQRALNWKPISLGAIFKDRGHAPPTSDTAKGRYIFLDVERCAAEQNMPYHWPAVFPFNSIPAARGFLYLQTQSNDVAIDYAHRVFDHAFGKGGDVSNAATLSAVAQACGADPVAFMDAIQSAAIKAKLVENTAEAGRRGVFGAPSLICDEQLFWGADRIEQMDRWLSK
jgi:2-hydroxychromene-2-carboxylate isomerase